METEKDVRMHTGLEKIKSGRPYFYLDRFGLIAIDHAGRLALISSGPDIASSYVTIIIYRHDLLIPVEVADISPELRKAYRGFVRFNRKNKRFHESIPIPTNMLSRVLPRKLQVNNHALRGKH